MKRQLTDPYDDDQPPLKSSRLSLTAPSSREIGNSSFLNNKKRCDVTFCIPKHFPSFCSSSGPAGSTSANNCFRARTKSLDDDDFDDLYEDHDILATSSSTRNITNASKSVANVSNSSNASNNQNNVSSNSSTSSTSKIAPNKTSNSHNNSLDASDTSEVCEHFDTFENNFEHVEYAEYPCIKCFFASHSKYFEAILFENQDANIDSKIRLRDVDCCTFEFVRDWVYPGQSPELSCDNVLRVLAFSHKYDLPVLFESCVDFVRNSWIRDKASLLHFLYHISCFDSISRHLRLLATADSILHNLPRILRSHRVLERYAEDCLLESLPSRVSLGVLKRLLECPSLTLREDKIWLLCCRFCSVQIQQQFTCCNLCGRRDVLVSRAFCCREGIYSHYYRDSAGSIGSRGSRSSKSPQMSKMSKMSKSSKKSNKRSKRRFGRHNRKNEVFGPNLAKKLDEREIERMRRRSNNSNNSSSNNNNNNSNNSNTSDSDVEIIENADFNNSESGDETGCHTFVVCKQCLDRLQKCDKSHAIFASHAGAESTDKAKPIDANNNNNNNSSSSAACAASAASAGAAEQVICDNCGDIVGINCIFRKCLECKVTYCSACFERVASVRECLHERKHALTRVDRERRRLRFDGVSLDLEGKELDLDAAGVNGLDLELETILTREHVNELKKKRFLMCPNYHPCTALHAYDASDESEGVCDASDSSSSSSSSSSGSSSSSASGSVGNGCISSNITKNGGNGSNTANNGKIRITRAMTQLGPNGSNGSTATSSGGVGGSSSTPGTHGTHGTHGKSVSRRKRRSAPKSKKMRSKARKTSSNGMFTMRRAKCAKSKDLATPEPAVQCGRCGKLVSDLSADECDRSSESLQHLEHLQQLQENWCLICNFCDFRVCCECERYAFNFTLLFKNLITHFVPLLRFENIRYKQYVRNFEPILDAFGLATASEQLRVHRTWHSGRSAEHARYEFEDNIIKSDEYQNLLECGDMVYFVCRLWESPKPVQAPFVAIDWNKRLATFGWPNQQNGTQNGSNGQQNGRNGTNGTNGANGANVAMIDTVELNNVLVFKNNMGNSNSQLQLEVGQIVKARHWAYRRSETSPWFQVRFKGQSGALAWVEIDPDCQQKNRLPEGFKNDWWVFDEDPLMLDKL